MLTTTTTLAEAAPLAGYVPLPLVALAVVSAAVVTAVACFFLFVCVLARALSA